MEKDFSHISTLKNVPFIKKSNMLLRMRRRMKNGLACESLTIIFNSEHVETKEITVKLLKIIKHTFRNTTYSKAIEFRFTMHMQYQ